MPLPRQVARFNRLVTNRILGPLAPYLPGFGVVIHRGRKTGHLFRTPVNVFRRPGGVMIALTYGPDSDWVKNVLAASWCLLETRGRIFEMAAPRLVHDPTWRHVPPILRPAGRLGNVTYFLELTRPQSDPPHSPRRPDHEGGATA